MFILFTPGIALLSLSSVSFAPLTLGIATLCYCLLLLCLLFCSKYCLVVIIITIRKKRKNPKLLPGLLELLAKKIWTRVKDELNSNNQSMVVPKRQNFYNFLITYLVKWDTLSGSTLGKELLFHIVDFIG